jgi:uncharacterized protein YwqG
MGGSGFTEFAEQAADRLLECVRMAPRRAGGGRSHLGGRPLLPAAAEWPRAGTGAPLSLLAELHLDELPDFPGRDVLPPGGVLQAWFDVEDCPFGGDGGLVTWLPSADGLSPREAPAGAAAHRHVPVAFLRWLTGAPGGALSEAAEAFSADRHGLGAAPLPPRHQLLGHLRPVQDDRLPEGSVLLLQIDSDDAAGWMFGDSGTLWFHARREDVQARRFGAVRHFWSCY